MKIHAFCQTKQNLRMQQGNNSAQINYTLNLHALTPRFPPRVVKLGTVTLMTTIIVSGSWTRFEQLLVRREAFCQESASLLAECWNDCRKRIMSRCINLHNIRYLFGNKFWETIALLFRLTLVGWTHWLSSLTEVKYITLIHKYTRSFKSTQPVEYI